MASMVKSSRSLSVLWLGLLLLMSLSPTSCSKSRFKPTYPVKGRVLVDGEPAEDVTVRFRSLDDPDDELVRPMAITDANGWFLVTTYKVNDGMPAGSYAVSIVWLPKGFRGPIERGNKLPARYSKPETSEIKVQIAAGENVLPTFELEKRETRGIPGQLP
jgi:hypothetical protein